MKITVSGKNVEVGESLSTHVHHQMEAFIEKNIGEALEGHATISKPTHLFHTDVVFHVSHNFTVRAQGEHEDAYRACDLALHKAEGRIRKYKSRIRDRKRHPKDDILNAATYVVSSEQEEVLEDTPLIIAENPSTIETLSVSDAVMRLDLSDYPVFVFKHAISGDINIVYRRIDGHFGWIAPNQKNS